MKVKSHHSSILISASLFGALVLSFVSAFPSMATTTAPHSSRNALLKSNVEGLPPLPAENVLFNNYLLGPGDEISLNVLGYEDYPWSSSQRLVLSDGSISLPLVGHVFVTGKTLMDLKAEIEFRLSRDLVEPEISLNLVTLRPVVVNVSGDVYRPGPIQLSGLTQGQGSFEANAAVNADITPTLTSALTAAGGIRRTADIRHVTVRRRLSTGETQDYEVNLWNALQGQGDLEQVILFDGDSILVPRAINDTDIDQSLVASSTISPTNVRVRVVGEGVVNPGEVEVQPNSSISSAVAAAGGPNADANLESVRLVRLAPNGQVEEQRIDLANLIDDYQIQDGDVVWVTKKEHLVGIDDFSRALTPILNPLLGLGSILGIFFD